MNAVTVASVAPLAGQSLLGKPGDKLALRVHGTEYDGRVVRLNSAKCVIGSAPDCTLRLRSRFVRPHHCLILRGAEHTIVRRWASSTQLNGATFDDAALAVGDRLSIGPIDFEVVSESEVAERASVATPAGEEAGAPDQSALRIELLEKTLADKERACANLADERNRVAAAANQLRITVDELRKKLAAEQGRNPQNDNRQGEPQQPEKETPNSAAVSLEPGNSGLDSAEREKLKKQIEQLKQDRERLADHIERSEKIFSKAAEIEAKVQSIEAELTSARQAQRRAEQERDELAAELQTQRAQIASESIQSPGDSTPEQSCSKPPTKRSAGVAGEPLDLPLGPDDSVEAISATICLNPGASSGAGGPRDAVTEFTTVQQTPTSGPTTTLGLSELKRKLDMLDPPPPVDVPQRPVDGREPSGPADSAERVEQTVRLRKPVSPAAEPSAKSPPRQEKAAPAADEGNVKNDQRSIEDYMSRLMARVGQGQTSPPPQQPGQGAVKRNSPPAARRPAAKLAETSPQKAELKEAVQDSTSPSPAETREMREMLTPHHRAPEDRADLRAMRELANSTARSAFDAQTARRLRRTVISKAICAVLSVASAGTCLYWAVSHGIAAAYLGASVGLIFATIWTAQATLLARRMKQIKNS